MNPPGVSQIEGFLGKERYLGKALYPGTFDPITYGHLDIVERAVGIFGEVIVIVADSMKKKPLFSLEERVEMAREATKDISNVQVDSLRSPLLVEEARMRGVKVVIRGLRAVSDYEYELQMALTNRRIAPEINTIFMISSSEYQTAFRESLLYVYLAPTRQFSNWARRLPYRIPPCPHPAGLSGMTA